MADLTRSLSMRKQGYLRIGSEDGDPINPEKRATIDQDGMSAEELARFLGEIKTEPDWRGDADKCWAYYDNLQLSADQLKQLKRWNLPPSIINMVRPAIDSVLGMEAKQRADFEVTHEDDPSEQVAQAMNVKLHEAQKRMRLDRAIADAFASQAKAGLGWVGLTVEMDPFQYRYKAECVDRRFIWWDWRDRSPDLSKARYLARRAWYDVDTLETMLPRDLADMARMSISNSPEWIAGVGSSVSRDTVLNQQMADGWSVERTFRAGGVDEDEWKSPERKRGMLIEVWYRRPKRGFVARKPNGDVFEIDLNNPAISSAIAQGIIRPMPATYAVMRQALYLGPHKIYDGPSPYSHRKFPYVPFWGFREDDTGKPYGLIRSMLFPQDAVNVRHSKMLALLSSRRVMVEASAIDEDTMGVDELRAEANAHDGFMLFKDGAIAKQRVHIESNNDMLNGQMQAFQEDKNLIETCSGIYRAMMGQNSNASSGVAIDSLVEQGAVTLAEFNDNYRFARQLCGEMTLDMIKQDMAGERNIPVPVGEGNQKKVIILNRPEVDDEVGDEVLRNSVANSRIKVALQDMPSTQSYRKQQFVSLSETVKGLQNPTAQAVALPYLIELSDVQHRKDMASQLRKMLNIPAPGTDGEQEMLPPEVQMKIDEAHAQAQQAQQQLQQAQQEMQKLQAADMQGKAAAAQAQHQATIDKANAEIEIAKIQVEKARADGQKALIDHSTKRLELGVPGDMPDFSAIMDTDNRKAEEAQERQAMMDGFSQMVAAIQDGNQQQLQMIMQGLQGMVAQITRPKQVQLVRDGSGAAVGAQVA